MRPNWIQAGAPIRQPHAGPRACVNNPACLGASDHEPFCSGIPGLRWRIWASWIPGPQGPTYGIVPGTGADSCAMPSPVSMRFPVHGSQPRVSRLPAALNDHFVVVRLCVSPSLPQATRIPMFGSIHHPTQSFSSRWGPTSFKGRIS